MLTIFGRSSGRADSNLSRRGFLQIGALSAFATTLNLADVFRVQAAQGTRRHKSVINIFLGGGPPHQDMFDLKTEAPSEVRGEFQPIATNVPGIQIGEDVSANRQADGSLRDHSLGRRRHRRTRRLAMHDRLVAARFEHHGRPPERWRRRHQVARTG